MQIIVRNNIIRAVLRSLKAIHAPKSSIVESSGKSRQSLTRRLVSILLTMHIQCTSSPHLHGNPLLGNAQLHKSDFFSFYYMLDSLSMHSMHVQRVEAIGLSHFNVRESYPPCATRSYRETFTIGSVYDESNMLAEPFLQ